MTEPLRVLEWSNFSANVDHHIRNYTIPQYGDFPHDQVAQDFDECDIAASIKRYANRVGRGQRGLPEQLRDCLKMAHYACMLYSKISGLDPRALAAKEE